MAKTTARRKSQPAEPEILWSGDTLEGFSFIILGQDKGRQRRYWWHCGGCWEHCQDAPVRELGDAGEDYLMHALLCPGRVSTASLAVAVGPETR
ncbi:hypothetical protein HZZ00_37415 (plasmid) [Streptomyces sp. NEAU-sy36]|uniref:hypothetical protein n=1 Tax=unclassified Streptomyces TaxID=2593676 RepID=UPI0015D65113|nr:MULTISPECIES: hypothetical protein [unclassified Streptomyces]QLJ06713.1 hypothetical protein HZZ00_37415 [Streptomyces sp. NEAU-sy36]